MTDTDVALVIHRFAGHEEEIRRRVSVDHEFRSVCEDYVDALRALATWKTDNSVAEEYDQLIEELEQEILGLLESPGSAGQYDRWR
jgi:hypothetical protein